MKLNALFESDETIEDVMELSRLCEMSQSRTAIIKDEMGDSYMVHLTVSHYLKNAYKDKEWLTMSYITKRMTMGEIGEVCGVTAATINQWLIKHQIPTRNRGRR